MIPDTMDTMDTMDTHSESDSDYEYEYHPTETETFYLNLDLTAHHGPIRPPRRRKEDPTPSDPNNSLQDPTITTTRRNDNHPNNHDLNQPIDSYTPLESTEESLTRERIQILDLNTPNPIITYLNQIFSCTWADQIGTELIFAHPDTDPDMDPDRHAPLSTGSSYELLAANSVKIIGRKTNLVPSGQGQGQGQGQNAGGMSNQAQFLQNLQEIKRNKGERDPVRYVYRVRRNGDVTERLAAWAKTEAQVVEVQRLKERAARGDEEALERLESLFRTYLDEQDDDEEDDEDDEDEEDGEDDDVEMDQGP